jgi:hypothetical protein
MALGDRQHVEAVAIMRALLEAGAGRDFDPLGPSPYLAAEVWLRENHPEPAVYMAAVAGVARGS